MALIPVINNHTGDEGEVDESWLDRWPEDFTALSPDHVPLVEQAAQTEQPSDGNPTLEEIS
jgi:hypothetical protein